MKKILLFIACMSVANVAQAARVENCDKVPHEVIITNGGEETRVTLEPYRHRDTYGPSVTFQMPGQAPVTPRWFDDWCIWSGKLHIQRRHRYNGGGGPR